MPAAERGDHKMENGLKNITPNYLSILGLLKYNDGAQWLMRGGRCYV